MLRRSIRLSEPILGGLCIILAAGCMVGPVQERPRPPAVWEVAAADLPEPIGDLPADGLKIAVLRSLDYLRRIPGERTYPLGDKSVTAQRIRDSLELFVELLDAGRLTRKEIARRFQVYRVGPEDRRQDSGSVLVTGYYEPVLKAGLEPDDQFRYPIYGIPPDLVMVDLGQFNPVRYGSDRVVGRVSDGRLLPYYTRAEIDGAGVLQDSGCELAWLSDPIDAFFLQVQGSGVLETPTGARLRVGYAASNGRPYRSIGKVLIDTGAIPAEQMSMQAIRQYLEAHPEERDEVLWQNQSYVFFRWVEQGPMGSLSVPLTAGRSIATDPTVYPKGVLSFLVASRPVVDDAGRVVNWAPLARWVVNQDTGGAIKGAGRVDLFCGTGAGAEEVAGRLKQPGTLYIVLKREDKKAPARVPSVF